LKQKFPHSRIKVHDVDETCLQLAESPEGL
jgi:hypothetical protein